MAIKIIKPEEIEEIRITDDYYLTEIVLKSGLIIKLKMPDVEKVQSSERKDESNE